MGKAGVRPNPGAPRRANRSPVLRWRRHLRITIAANALT